MTFDMKNSTFTRQGSFRQQTMTERLAVTDTAVVAPTQNTNGVKPYNPFAIERPHATPSMLERQGSFRGFTQIGAASPFKRQMSLRINDLPSNAERQRAFLEPTTPHRTTVSPIPEISPQPSTDTVSQLCQELSQGLSLLTKNDADDFYLKKEANNIASTNSTVTSAAIVGSYITNTISATSPPDLAAPSSVNPLPNNIFAPSSNALSQPTIPPRSVSPIRQQTVDLSLSSTLTGNSVATTNSSMMASSSSASALATGPSPQKVVPVETASPLPNPEQWLGQIVKNVSPSPRRAPSLHSRTKSLNAADPFDAEWVAEVAKPEIHSTNPFISPPKPPAQSFQVHL